MLTDPFELLTQLEYANLRRCSERTVERERSSGTGCPYVKIGRAVRYRRRDILDFIEEHLRQSTSEAAESVSAPGTRARERSRPPERNPQPRHNGTARERSTERAF